MSLLKQTVSLSFFLFFFGPINPHNLNPVFSSVPAVITVFHLTNSFKELTVECATCSTDTQKFNQIICI